MVDFRSKEEQVVISFLVHGYCRFKELSVLTIAISLQDLVRGQVNRKTGTDFKTAANSGSLALGPNFSTVEMCQNL